METSIDSREYWSALEVLEREQRENSLNPRDELFFRVFNIIVWLFSAFYVIYLIASNFNLYITSRVGPGNSKILFDVLFWIIVFFTAASFITFLLNTNLINKLWVQSRLRKRLSIDVKFAEYFKLERSNGKSSRQLRIEGALAILGVVILLIETYLVFKHEWRNITIQSVISSFTAFDWKTIFGITANLSFILAPTTLGAFMVSRYYMRRGKDRTEIASRLHKYLSKERERQGESNEPFMVSSAMYEKIAKLEREQIVGERHQSISRGKRKRYAAKYVIQKSHGFLDAVDKLDSERRVLVEDAILELTINPVPTNSRTDAKTGFRRLSIPKMEIDLVYQLAKDKRRIIIYSMDAERAD